MKINRTAQRTVEILELIASSESDLTLNEIATTLRIPKTSAFDILETLVHMKMLYIKEQRLKTYSIGVKAYVIGNNYSKTSLLLNSSSSIIKNVAKITGYSVLIAKEDGRKVIYTMKHEPDKKIIATPEIGDRDYLHATSAGKAILAFSQEHFDQINQSELKRLTEWTITSTTDLKAELFDIRTQGYAVSQRENGEHLFSIAAPIFDFNGVVSAAVELVGLYIEGDDYQMEIESVKAAALEISKRQGWHGREDRYA